MRLGRSISAVALSSFVALVGVFLGLSPWFEGLNHGGPWSRATQTDFWSGVGLVLVGLATVMLYQRGVVRELQEGGVLSRPTRVDEQAESDTVPGAATPQPMNDAELLELAHAVVRDIADSKDSLSALTTTGSAAPSEEELVRLATHLLEEIQAFSPESGSAASNTAPEDRPLALMSEPELARMAAELLQEIQHSQESSFVLARKEGRDE